MKISIKSTGFTLTPSINQYIEKRLGAISKLLKKQEEEGSVEMRVEVARTTRHHKKGEVYKAEVNLKIPGKLLRAAKDDEDLMVAIDEIANTLRLEVEKYKSKNEPKAKARRSPRAGK